MTQENEESRTESGPAPSGGIPQPWLASYLRNFQQLDSLNSAMNPMEIIRREVIKNIRASVDYRVVPEFDVREFYGPLFEAIEQARRQAYIDGFIGIVTGRAPENWPELDAPIRHRRLLNVAAFGVPVAWVPPAEVLTDLARSEPDGYGSVLIRHRAAIVESCQRVVVPVWDGPYAEQVAFIDQCLKALSAGAFAACQILAAVVAETALRIGFVPSSKVEGEKKAPPWVPTPRDHVDQSKNFEEGDFRRTLVLVPFQQAYRQFEYDDFGEGQFGRNASEHRADFRQFTLVNALISLMLAVSVLREAHEDQQR